MERVLLIVQYTSILGFVLESFVVFRRMRTVIHSYLLLSCITGLINNLGYLFELKSRTEGEYLMALRFSYLGREWFGFFMFLFVMELCGKHIPKFIRNSVFLINMITYTVICTVQKHNLYYHIIRFDANGIFPKLIHTDGIWHQFNMILQVTYVLIGLGVIFKAYIKEKGHIGKERFLMVMFAIFVEGAFFIIQIVGIHGITEFYDVTMIGYFMGTVFMFIAILRYDLMGTREIAREYMIDRLSEGIIAVDSNGIVQYYNEVAKKIYPELHAGSGNVPQEIIETLESGENLTKDDCIYTLEKNEMTSGKESIGTLYAMVDNTQYYLYTKELEKQKKLADSANEAKSAFLAYMSHDIRTPINAIIGMNEMIQRECNDRSILNYSNKIRSAGNTLLGLVNDILDFSKIEAGKLEIIPVDYEPASVLIDLVSMIQQRADAKGLEVKLKFDNNIPRLLNGDEIRIKQIITNILTNAVKYTEKGYILFEVGCDKCGEDYVNMNVSISDTGIGIKPDDLKNLFSDFERFEGKRNRKIEGTGLGMGITKRLLLMMGSELIVKSEYGKGSVFSFSIKQKVVSSEPSADFNRIQNPSLAKKYEESFIAPDAEILFIDDTEMNLEVFVSLLKKTGVKVDTGQSGDEALSYVKQKKYDVIFLDHMMPEKDGIETLKEMREMKDNLNNDTPVICLTANAVSGSREKYLQAGFDNYITKPVEPAKLEQMILHYLPESKLKKNEDEELVSDNLPEWLTTIKEIDTETGLTFCGTMESYINTINIYAGKTLDNADEIERYYHDNDIKNLTIKVHALKSTSRMIGATELGNLAEKLEKAGNDNDIETINSHIDELISRYRRLGNTLLISDKKEEKDERKEISQDELMEAYTAIKEFMSFSDYDSAVQIIEGLKNYKIPGDERKRCDELIKAAEEINYELFTKILK